MKYWKYSFWLSVFSIAIIIISLSLPASYSVFVWDRIGASAGVLFPALFASWLASIFSIACNYIFVDMIYMHKAQQTKQFKKYLPSLLSTPALFTFLWFCYRWYRGNPGS